MTAAAIQDRLEAEAICILREAVAEARRPVLLFSGGKDSTVLAHLALKAFHPGKPPFPLLHVDSTWEFRELLEFRDRFAAQWGWELLVRRNEDGRRRGLNPYDHGEYYTDAMRTSVLKAALDEGGFDVIFGGARRDEDASRAKERIVSVRRPGHVWDPRQQRPELWRLYNCRINRGETLRVFPLSNWTEMDIWAYVVAHRLDVAPLYFAARRPGVRRADGFYVLDDLALFRLRPGEHVETAEVRFRSLGCWPITAAIESGARDGAAVFLETFTARRSERYGRAVDAGSGGTLEAKKREGYF